PDDWAAEVLRSGRVAGRVDASVGAMAAGTVTAAAVATDAIDADALAGSALSEIAAGITIPTPPTPDQIADAILDRDLAAGADSGSAARRTLWHAVRFLPQPLRSAGGAVF